MILNSLKVLLVQLSHSLFKSVNVLSSKYSERIVYIYVSRRVGRLHVLVKGMTRWSIVKVHGFIKQAAD
jgi:hypothetical protein